LMTLINSGTQATGSTVLQMNLLCDACEYEWYRVTYSLIFRADGIPAQAVISLENVTEQHAREVAYQRWEKTYESMPQSNTAYLEFDLTQNRLDVQKGTLLLPVPNICINRWRVSFATISQTMCMRTIGIASVPIPRVSAC